MKVWKNAKWALAFALPLVTGTGNAATSLTNGMYKFTAAPGTSVVDASWPLFKDQGETITVKKIGTGGSAYWQLTGKGNAASFWGSTKQAYSLGNERVIYQANFNAAGQLIADNTKIGLTTIRNFLEIRGTLQAGKFGNTPWKAVTNPNTVLLSATLLGGNKSNGIGVDYAAAVNGSKFPALGFTTKFNRGSWILGQRGLTGGSTGESLWLTGASTGFRDLVLALDGNSRNGTLNSLIGASKTIGAVTSVAAVPLPGAAWLFLGGLMTVLASRRKSVGSRLAA